MWQLFISRVFALYLIPIVLGLEASVWDLTVSRSEFDALFTFYNATQGVDWLWLNTTKYGPLWNFQQSNGQPVSDPCSPSWQGLQCVCAAGACQVESITLPDYNLNGWLADSLRDFAALKSLNLSHNVELGGYFPVAPIFPPAIESIDLSKTSLAGTLPSYLWTLSHLKTLRLSDTSLAGPLSPNVANLTAIVELDLGRNRLAGAIPVEICQLATLEKLKLDHNLLSGTVFPQLTQLTHLKHLHWQGNHIAGSLPVDLANMTALEDFNVAYNLINGTLPPLGRARTLRTVNVGFNLLTGSLPSYFLTLDGLVTLNVARNFLHSSVPSFAGDSSVMNLIFDDNYFTGTLPDCYYRHMPRLSFLSLQNNIFHGTLPAAIGQLTALRNFYVGNNYLVSSLPAELFALPSLSILSLDYNFFNGSLSANVSRLASLRVLNVAYNDLTGTVPAALGRLSNMTRLYLCGNHFHGSIPADLGDLRLLRYLLLNANLLTGTIPASFKQLTNLGWFYASENQLHGELYAILAAMPKLIDVVMFNNAFTGPLPYNADWRDLLSLSFGFNYLTGGLRLTAKQVTKLVYVDLSKNLLSTTLPAWTLQARHLSYFYMNENFVHGTLPQQSVTATALVELWMDGNVLTGGLPAAIGNCSFLQLLRVGSNFLSGTVPTSLATLRFLETLFLQSNFFSGGIDALWDAAEQRRLKYVDISDNYFVGTLPPAAFNSTSLVSFAAATNCFSGSLPAELCLATQLEDLVLDGASTAARCQRAIFATSSLWKSSASPSAVHSTSRPRLSTAFVLTKRLTHGVPPCLFAMPRLQLLHLSGNALTGSLPPDVRVSSSLRNVSIANNQLSGPLPLALQRQAFQNLDVSYNKFSGTLSADIPPLWANGSFLALRNRLSGDVPASLRLALNVSILEGNLFSCDSLRRDLPRHDPKAASYSCGSDQTNRALILWACLWPTLLVLLALLDRCLWRIVCRPRTKATATVAATVAAAWTRLWRVVRLLTRWRQTLYVPLQLLLEEDEAMHRARFKGDGRDNGDESGGGSGDDNEGDAAKVKPQATDAAEAAATLRPSSRSLASLASTEDAYSGHHGPVLASVLPPHRLTAAGDRFTLASTSPSLAVGAGREASLFHRVGSQVLRSFIAPLAPATVADVAPVADVDRDSAAREDASSFSRSDNSDASSASVLSAAVNVRPPRATAATVASSAATRSTQSTRLTTATTRTTASASTATAATAAAWSERIYLLSSFGMMQRLYGGLTLVAVVALLPVYVALSVAYGTYSHSYVWRLSPMLLSGLAPGYGLFFVFVALLSAVWWRVDYHKRVVLRSMYEYQLSWPQLSFYALFALVDMAILLSVNVLYVLAVPNARSWVLFLSEAGLAAFKVAWNELVVIRGFAGGKTAFFAYVLGRGRAATASASATEADAASATSLLPAARHRSVARERLISTTQRRRDDPQYGRFYDLIVQLALIIANLLLMPAVATAVANANCFYNVLQPPATVAGGFQLAACNDVVEFGRIVVCLGRTAVYDSVTYTAPFLYTYQCSSFLVINYASVYVYFVVLVTVLVPLAKALYRLWRLGRRHDDAVAAATAATAATVAVDSPLHSDRGRSGAIVTTAAATVDAGDGDVDAANADDDDDDDDDSDSDAAEEAEEARVEAEEESLFDKRQLIIRLQSYLALLLIFGVLFPPMAVVVCVGAAMMMFFEEVLVGHVLYTHSQRASEGDDRDGDVEAAAAAAAAVRLTDGGDGRVVDATERRLRRQFAACARYRLYLLRENAEVLRYLTNPVLVWLLLTVVSSIYGYLLFDTMGDALVADGSNDSSATAHATLSHGARWRVVVTLTALTVLWPTLLLLVSLWRRWRSRWRCGGGGDATKAADGGAAGDAGGGGGGGGGWSVDDVAEEIRRERRRLRLTTRRLFHEEQARRRQWQQQRQRQRQPLSETRASVAAAAAVARASHSSRGPRPRPPRAHRRRSTVDHLWSELLQTAQEDAGGEARAMRGGDRDGGEDDDDAHWSEAARDSRALRLSEMVTMRLSNVSLASTAAPSAAAASLAV